MGLIARENHGIEKIKMQFKFFFFFSFTIIYNLIITWVSCDVLSSHVNQDITLLVFSGVVGSRTMCISLYLFSPYLRFRFFYNSPLFSLIFTEPTHP